MKRLYKSVAYHVLAVFCSLALSVTAHAQVRGQALYDLLSDEATVDKLIKFEGSASVTWAPDGKSYIIREDDTFKRVSAETGKKSRLFNDRKLITTYNYVTGEKHKKLPFESVKFVDEGRKIKFARDNRVFFYNLKNDELRWFLRERPITGVRDHVYHEVFSPDLNYRAYTRNYNLYIKDEQDREVALTTLGNTNVRNGFPDWVYPEELGQYDAFWWSPNSDKIAYMQFDENPVYKYPLVYDTTPKPLLKMQSYPRAGENNPIVKLFIVDIETQKTVQIETGNLLDVYLVRGKWSPDGKQFYYQRLNRLQNKLELWTTDPDTGKTSLVFTETSDTYINLNDEMKFIRDGKQLLWTSERTGFNEIFIFDFTSKKFTQLTNARLPIGDILSVNEKNGWIYFSGYENRGLESHLYRVKLDGSQLTRLTKEAGSHDVDVSPNGRYYTDSFSSFTSPQKVTMHKGDGSPVRTLGNSTVTRAFKKLKLVAPEHITFKAADGKTDLDALAFKPAHFDPQKKYPVILSLYGGPETRQSYNKYLMADKRQALAQLGFIVLSTDHRGGGRRGKAFATSHYMKLGQVEAADHAQAVESFTQMPYADGSRVGVFGHSYGGYLTIMLLLKYPDIFHVGVSGAPVTAWNNYDSIYTERYMRRPKDNPDGYEKSSAINYVKNLKGKLYIHHGAVDNNVHPGNAVQLLDALLEANKKFDFMLYPGQQHRINFKRYGESRVEYFIEHLRPEIL